MTRRELTQYGFNFGAAEVTRIHEEKNGSVHIGITTPKTKPASMQIYVTKTGKVRVFGADSREWKP
jgi:hypothetical protein